MQVSASPITNCAQPARNAICAMMGWMRRAGLAVMGSHYKKTLVIAASTGWSAPRRLTARMQRNLSATNVKTSSTLHTARSARNAMCAMMGRMRRAGLAVMGSHYMAGCVRVSEAHASSRVRACVRCSVHSTTSQQLPSLPATSQHRSYQPAAANSWGPWTGANRYRTTLGECRRL